MKSSALTKWLVTTITTIALAMSSWAGLTLIAHEKSIAEMKADREAQSDQLSRIEKKIDSIERYLRRDR